MKAQHNADPLCKQSPGNINKRRNMLKLVHLQQMSKIDYCFTTCDSLTMLSCITFCILRNTSCTVYTASLKIQVDFQTAELRQKYQQIGSFGWKSVLLNKFILHNQNKTAFF